MCFSASASFIASGALTLLGIASFTAARKKDKILTAIPILFGIQQAFEGVQWLYLNRGTSSLFAGYGFLFFALLVWPIYVPVFVFWLDRKRRTVLLGFIAVGAVVALYFARLLATQSLHVREHSSCVSYAFHFNSERIVVPMYLFATFGSLFASSRPIFRWFGLAISVLAFISWMLYARNFISAWCFFAAAVSSMFFIYVQYKRRLRNVDGFLNEPGL